MRQEVREASTDGEGDTIRQIYRSYRRDTNQAVELLRVWSAKIADYQVQSVEENMRFLRLVFPVRAGKTWDGITYLRTDTVVPYNDRTQETINLFKDWGDFSLTNIDQPMTINGLYFPETVTVLQVDKTNNIERRYAIEVYAKNVGLVFKEMWILDTQCGGNIANCLGQGWEEKAEKGFILRQQVVGYGG